MRAVSFVLAVLAVFSCSGALGAGPAEQGDAEACHRLAGSPRDPQGDGAGVVFGLIEPAEAITACRAALDQSPSDARLQYQLARALDAGGDAAAALAGYRAAAESGSAVAMRALGLLHELGLGVGQDFTEARRHYQAALEAGLGDAAGDLGNLYENGMGVSRDHREALKYYEQGVEAGDPWSMMKMGWMHDQGLGVPKDAAVALGWYRRAADAGDARGQANLGVFHERGLGGLAADPAEAARLYRLAAEQKDGLGMYNLANLLAQGRGVEQDIEESLRLARAAIVTGDTSILANAQNHIAWIQATRGGDLEEALQLSKAAVSGTAKDAAEYPSFLDTLAWVEHKRGNHAEALRLMLEVAELQPNHAVTFDHLGDIYAALGRKGEAAAAWRRALEAETPDPVAAPEWDRAAVEAKLKAS